MISKNDEISSTEKLLDTIRSKDTSIEDKIPAVSPATPSTKAIKSFLTKILPSKEPITVGIDIGYNGLRLVKVKQFTDQKWRLMDFRCIQFNPEISKKAAEFNDFLKTALSEFCGPLKDTNIWCIMSAALVDVKRFLIPKVPKKQIENTIFWKVKKEFRFDEKESILDYRVQYEVIDKGVNKLSVISYVAPKNKVKDIENLFSKIGFPLTGISIASFAIQNLFSTGWISTPDETITNLNIGHEWSRIDIYSKGNLVLTRGIKSGVNSMIQSIMDGYNETIMTTSLLQMAGEEDESGKGADKMDMEQARKVLLSLRPDSSPLTEKDLGYQLKEEEIFELIQPAADRLARQVERTFEYYISTSDDKTVGKVYNSGEVYLYGSLVDYIEKKLGIEMEVNDPLNPDKNPYLGDVTLPELVLDRAPYVLAVAIALSDNNHTLNFIFTYKNKIRKKAVTQISRGIFFTTMLTLSIAFGFFLWAFSAREQKQEETVRLSRQLEQLGPRVNKDLVLQMTAKIKNRQKTLKEYSERFRALSVINEISALTPSNIKLLSLTIDLGSVPLGKSEMVVKTLLLDGIIIGEHQMHETSLVGYMMKLEDSPIFSSPKVFKGALEPYGEEGDALRFTIELKLN
jgi:Tfp pilus assembly PilM family ATPase